MQILYTIGYTKKSLEEFVTLLTKNNIEKLIDIRLKNTSQLAGFSKEEDLRFILQHLLNIEYEHIPLLSPTEEIFNQFKKSKNWDEYLKSFTQLMIERRMDSILEKAILNKNRVCLLCSEDSPKKCHRRLVAESYKNNIQPDIKIVHLTKKDISNKSL